MISILLSMLTKLRNKYKSKRKKRIRPDSHRHLLHKFMSLQKVPNNNYRYRGILDLVSRFHTFNKALLIANSSQIVLFPTFYI